MVCRYAAARSPALDRLPHVLRCRPHKVQRRPPPLLPLRLQLLRPPLLLLDAVAAAGCSSSRTSALLLCHVLPCIQTVLQLLKPVGALLCSLLGGFCFCFRLVRPDPPE